MFVAVSNDCQTAAIFHACAFSGLRALVLAPCSAQPGDRAGEALQNRLDEDGGLGFTRWHIVCFMFLGSVTLLKIEMGDQLGVW